MKGQLAEALAELTGDAASYYVSVTTRDVDRRVAKGAKSCKLDAGLLTVAALDGLTPETLALMTVLGEYDVPAIVVVTKTETASPDEIGSLTNEIYRHSKQRLGYAAPVYVVPSLDQALSADKLKELAEEAQVLAHKRRKRRSRPGRSPKDYPFVIDQSDLERLMRQNVQVALEEHRDRGETVVVWRGGELVKLTGEEIDLGSVPGRPRK
ncbi:MAG: hypothetical protein GY944_10060 [bacterium]|nr:hypothetical protein [bacterium]